jgi:nitrogen fixation-related uncharacterized protein
MRWILLYIAIPFVLITPFIHSDALYNGINSAKQLWFCFAASLLLAVLSVKVVLASLSGNRHTGLRAFKLNFTDLLLTVFYLYFFIRSLTTPYTPLMYNQEFINLTLLIIIYLIIRGAILKGNSREGRHTSSTESLLINDHAIKYFIIFIIMTGLAEAIWGLLQLYGLRRSFNSNFRITGSFFNPAPYALYLAAVFPAALRMYLDSAKPEKNRIPKLTEERFSQARLIIEQLFVRDISMFTVITIILVLPATMIRASWLGALAGSAVVLNDRYDLLKRSAAILKTPVRKAVAWVSVIIIALLSVTGMYYLKRGSSTGKLLIWKVTIDKTAERPLFGQGVGRFEAEYNNWQADYFRYHPQEMESPKGIAAGNTKYCFNEFLEMAAETGIAGFILFVGLLVPVFMREKKSQNAVHKVQGFGCGEQGKIIPSLTALLVTAAVSFPFYSLPTLILFFSFLALISVHKAPVTVIRLPAMVRIPLSVAVVLLLIGGSIFLFGFTKKQYKSYYAMDEAVRLYQSGSYDESCDSFSDVYNDMKHNGPYLQYYAKALLMGGRYEESIRMYERAKDYTGDEMLYCSLGDAYKAIKRYVEAEEAYIHASYMVPHKLYPLYLLAILYDETNQRKKAVAIAENVLNKEIKVESQAVEEIRIKIRCIIEKYRIKRNP